MNTTAMLLLALSIAAPPQPARQSATVVLVGTVEATHALPDGGCTMDLEVGAGAPVTVLVLDVLNKNACSLASDTKVLVHARVVAAYFLKIGSRFWFEATEVRVR